MSCLSRRSALLAGAALTMPHWGRAQPLPADGQVANALARLGSNEAVALPPARIVGEFNETARRFALDRTGPQARDYSLKMAWAADRRRALFAGANHGAPHRLNDVWEFDLGARSWHLLYAPDLPRRYTGLGTDASDVEFRGGILTTNRGGPAVIGHTWWGLTYDASLRQMLFMNTWVTKQAAAIRQLGGDPAARYTGPPLWSFDPASAQWAAAKSPPPWPAAPFGSMLEYVAAMGGSIWHANHWQMRSTWLYTSRDRRWARLAGGDEAFQHASPPREAVAYVDPQRGIVVAQAGRRTFHFDTRERSWQRVADAFADEAAAPDAHDARTPMYWDAGSAEGLLVDFAKDTLWAYDPDRRRWRTLQPRGPALPPGRKRLAYADAAAGVLVVIADTAIWVYRHGAR